VGLTANFRAETRAAIAAVRAALLVVQSRHGAQDVRRKGSRDLVTGTDLAAQAAMQRVLHEYDAAIAFVGEEGDARVPEAGRYWLVDPLCGTANFAAELPLFAINVALVEGGHVAIGVVADGATGEIHVAERGQGAYHLEREERLQVNPNASQVSLDPTLPGPDKLSRFGAELAIGALRQGQPGLRVLGTTLALIYLARGRLAAAVYVNDGLPVHFAAGLLIAEEAGAIITDERGQPWQVMGPIYIAAANGELHEALRELAQHTADALQSD
jgi:myo-inositol-1(or 4)-monophosphatase